MAQLSVGRRPLLDANGSLMLTDWLSRLRPYLVSLAFVAATTLVLFELTYLVELDHVGIVYVVPVLASAILWGIWPAIAAAVAGVTATAYFFYAPIFSLGVYSGQQILDLILFVVVALVTSNLASRVRNSLVLARQNENETAALYAFARRLAVATSSSDIYEAIQDYMNAVLQYRAIVLEGERGEGIAASLGRANVPETVREAVTALAAADPTRELLAEDGATRGKWLVRALSPKTHSLGYLAVEISASSRGSVDAARQRIEAVLKDATATLERLDIERLIGETRTRSEAETFREALIESVSHELRTPLASIMGATSVLATVPSVSGDPRLSALADVVRDEAERLNGDIQNLLDASRIRREGIRVHQQWVEALDIVNSVVQRQQRRLAGHRVAIDFPDDLPLLRVDPGLIEQALGQIMDNAAKYSQPGSEITIAGRAAQAEVQISVSDQGAGLAADESEQIWDRFYRSPRLHAVPGSGLGLWIARAFTTACGGKISARSSGQGKGTTITLSLPAPRPETGERFEDADE